MEETLLTQEPTKTWPPEKGWPLFLAWMAGAIATVLLSVVIQSAFSQSVWMGTSGISWSFRLMFIIPALLEHAWQAWLLFRKQPVRFALWLGLPLVTLVSEPEIGFEYAFLVLLLIQAALIRRVRQRWWIWIILGIAGMAISTVGAGIFRIAGYFLQNFIKSASGGSLPAWLGSLILWGSYRGSRLLSEALTAWALAWKMPPVSKTMEHRSSAPAEGAPIGRA